jgi:SAM-dependent methyltransferase
MTDPELPDSIAGNVAQWTRSNADFTDANAERSWEPHELTWGVFGVREDDIGSPLGDVSGLDVVELGCGTAYFSAQLAMRGARPVGVDPTPAQLATARRMQDKTGIAFPLVEAPAERVPLPDSSFDLAISEFGASLWADPQRWIPEAARLLRPGGRLVFLTNSTIAYLCFPDESGISETLQRPQFGMYRIQWPNEQGTEYHLSHGDWIDLLRANDFEIERLIEPPAPPDAEQHTYYDYVTPEWARQWPAEEIWVARKRGGLQR